MPTSISIDATGPKLKELLEHLPKGETVSILGSDGEPMAVVIPAEPPTDEAVSPEVWIAEWRALAQEIGKAWKSDKSAVELLSEMRR